MFSYQDEKNTEITQPKLEKSALGCDDKNKNNEVECRTIEMEVVAAEENVNEANTEEANKEAKDDYEHSLWKWPAGRSCLTKVQ